MTDADAMRVEDGKRLGPRNSRVSPITLASLMGMATQAVSLVLGLWSTPRLLHGLGDAAYGALAVVSTFAAYFAYLELGIGGAYLRDLAISLSRRDLDRAQALYETAHAIYVRIGIAGGIGILAIGLPYLRHTMRDPVLLSQVQMALLVLAINFFLSMCLSASRAVVLSAQRPDLYNFASFLVQPAIPIAQVIAISRGYGMVSLLAIQGMGSLGVDIAMLWLAKRLVPTLALRRRFHRQVWGDLRSFSAYKFLSQLGMQGQLSGDRLLLSALVPLATIAPYAVAASIAQRIRIVAAAISGPFYTAASNQYGRDGVAGLLKITGTFCRPVCALLAVGTAAAIFLSRPFLSAWIGEHYAIQGAAVLRLVVVSTSLLVIANLLGWSADAAGAPRVNAWAALSGLCISDRDPWFLAYPDLRSRADAGTHFIAGRPPHRSLWPGLRHHDLLSTRTLIRFRDSGCDRWVHRGHSRRVVRPTHTAAQVAELKGRAAAWRLRESVVSETAAGFS